MKAAPSRRIALLIVAAAFAQLGAPAVAAAAAPASVPATVPALDPLGSVQFDLPSRVTGRTYRITVYKPATPAPAGGWPVITVLDGRSTFAIAASQVYLRTATGRPGAVVVGVAYPQLDDTFRLRQIDLTPSRLPPGTLASPGTSPTDAGEAALFQRFLTEELRPVIAAMEPVDPGNQALIGYSLGGLFALGVMFDHPQLFRTIVAGSPSIWWNNREVLAKEAKFVAAVEAGTATPRLLITSDRWEQYPPEALLPSEPASRAAYLARMKGNAMVDNAQALATRLAAVKGADGYRVRQVVFEDEEERGDVTAEPEAV